MLIVTINSITPDSTTSGTPIAIDITVAFDSVSPARNVTVQCAAQHPCGLSGDVKKVIKRRSPIRVILAPTITCPAESAGELWQSLIVVTATDNLEHPNSGHHQALIGVRA